MNTKALIAGGVTAAALITPQLASAHNSVVSCPAKPGGAYVASADAKYGVPTVTDNHDGTVTLSWPDGFKRTKPAPADCEVPPTPAPTPNPPEVTPPPVGINVTPPTCADLKILYPKAGKARLRSWGCPIPPKPHYTVVKKVTTIQAHACTIVPKRRAYHVNKIVVTWYKDGLQYKQKIRLVKIEGRFCSIPVAG